MHDTFVTHAPKVLLWPGYLLVLGGALFQALSIIINKKQITKKAPPDVVSAITFLGSGLLLLSAAFLFDPPDIQSVFDGIWGIFWPLLVTCLLNIVIMYGSVRALQYADASLVAPMSAFQPLFGIVPAWLILGEVPTTWGFVGLFSVLVGLWFFSVAEGKMKSEDLEKLPAWLKSLDGKAPRWSAYFYTIFRNRGVKIMLLVTLCGATSINFDKKAAMLSSPLFACALIMLFLGVIGVVKIFRTGEWRKVTKDHRVHLVFGTVTLAITLVCYWLAFRYGLAIYIGALKRVNTVFVLLLAWLWLKEEKVGRRWPGILIIGGGSALLAI